jgi:hypothetical protein
MSNRIVNDGQAEAHLKPLAFDWLWLAATSLIIAVAIYMSLSRTPEEIEAHEAKMAIEQCLEDQQRMWATPNAAAKQAQKCKALAEQASLR